MRHARIAASFAALALTVAACGNSRSSSPQTDATTAPGGTPTTAPSVAMFGDAPMPCGPAPAGTTNTATDSGVTANSITIATGDDRGYAGALGLDKEMSEAVQDMAAACNALGGINGRTIKVNFYDAAVLQVQEAMTKACAGGNFMLVGEGWSLDANQEETRLGCKLPAVPGYAVSAAFSNAPLMYQAVPVPANRLPGEVAIQLKRVVPQAITKGATLAGNFSATQEPRDKVVAGYPHYGFKFLPHSNVEYPITGQADWTTTVKQLQSLGATLVYWSGQCTYLQPAMRAARQIGFKAVWQTETNHYEAKCAASNTDGAMDGVYIRMAFVPFEDRAVNKAVSDYLKLIAKNGQHPTQLGAQATSSFLLWATAVQQCGANVTRACVLGKLANIHSWTGHGLHAETDPGANLPPKCGVLLQLEGTKYVRVSPKDPGKFDCDPDSLVTVDTPAVRAAKLDANGIAHQFGG